MKKIYIAGYDVFSDDALKIGEEYKQICSIYGFCGLYPLDNKLSSSKDIFNGNISLTNLGLYLLLGLLIVILFNENAVNLCKVVSTK